MAQYIIETPNHRHLIEANSKAQAVSHVVKNTVKAHACSASEAVRLVVDDGLALETAGEGGKNPVQQEVVSEADALEHKSDAPYHDAVNH